ITAHLRYDESNKLFEGVVTNNSAQPITHAHLVLGDDSLDVGTLTPGENQIVGRATPRYSNFYDVSSLSGDEALDLASRDLALQSLLRVYRYPSGQSNLEGLFLVGWQAGSPVDINVANASVAKQQDTLLVVGLPFTKN
ncbi:MAG: hypothetical protein R3264_23485, partial [Anaerolineae bacterium]|nr:hypothetical protein [Anaerolineae bacterium]